jgi:hypothetical protein
MKRINLLIAAILCFLFAGFIAYKIVWAFPPTPPANPHIADITSGTITGANITDTPISGSTGSFTTLTISGKVNWGKASDVASASTTDIGAANGVVVDITGTTPITSFGNVTAGTTRLVRFTGATTITANATSMVLPGARDITTAAGDRATFVSLGSGNWICHAYMKAAGIAIGGLSETVTASNATLTRDVMFGGQINTFGQTNDTTISLLAIEKGMNFCVVIGTTVAKYLRVDPNASDSIYDGSTTAGDGKYFGVTSAAAGQKICFEAFQTGASAYDWSISYLGAWATE